MNLSKRCVVRTAITPTEGAAAATALNGTILDTQGYDGVMAVVRFGAITAGATTSVKWQSGAAANLSDAADLTGTSITVADNDDDQIFVSDLYRPRERYVRLVVARGTQNAVVASAVYVLYGAHEEPTTMDLADKVTAETHVSPAEGTA